MTASTSPSTRPAARPKRGRRLSTTRRALLALGAAACVATTAADAQAVPDLDATTRLIVERSNAFRSSQDRAPLRTEARLTSTAQGFAEYMAQTDRHSHEADGRTAEQRVAASGYAYCALGENIAFRMSSAGFRTEELAAEFVEGWKNSPPHRRNLLNPDVSEIGVGVAQSRKSRRYYAVQVFARPASEAIRFSVTNQSGREVGYRLDDEAFRLRPLVTRTHTICTAAPLALAGAAPVPTTAGARFTIDADGGALRLRRD